MSQNSFFIQLLKTKYQLSENAEMHLLPRIKTLTFSRGHFLQLPHEVSKKIYFVAQGIVRSFALEEGTERTIDFASSGHFCTIAHSFFQQKKTPYGMLCETECQLFALSYYDLMSLCDELLEFVLLSNQLLTQHMLYSISANQRHRNASILERFEQLCKTHAGIAQQVKHKDLASYLGITPQSFTRLLKRHLNAKR